jgi:hypothetical protein
MKPTSRPGSRSKAWWNGVHYRALTVEISYLLAEAPLDISDGARRLARLLWRLRRRTAAPTHHQLAQYFEVDERTIGRWVNELEDAHMLIYRRPYNIPDGKGGWKGPRKAQGSYKRLPPSQWTYKNDWRYLGANGGWCDADGVVVEVDTPWTFPATRNAPHATGDAQRATATP